MNKIALFIIRLSIFTLLIIPVSLNGQTYEQKTPSGQVYQVTKRDGIDVINKKNTVNWKNMGECCYSYNVGDFSSIFDTVKTVFSNEKLKALGQSKKMLIILFFCNRSGEVVNVEFLLYNMELSPFGNSSISLEELERIEQKVLKVKIPLEISPDCTNKYFVVNTSIRFKDLVKESK